MPGAWSWSAQSTFHTQNVKIPVSGPSAAELDTQAGLGSEAANQPKDFKLPVANQPKDFLQSAMALPSTSCHPGSG